MLTNATPAAGLRCLLSHRLRQECLPESCLRLTLVPVSEGSAVMAGIVVHPGQGETLNVLGMPLRYLCSAADTDGAWSLMEEEIGFGQGPPAHKHDWDEAY